ncbi:MAG: endonuclease III [Deltaproteobacteria bacterium]|nr:endonuclease III [Deltaproteobacteria bacterium]
MPARAASLKERTDRAAKIVALLRQHYPSSRSSLDYTTPLELLVATMLSAQCTDKKVNEVTKPLFKKYRSAHDFACARQTVLEQEVHQTGFFRMKAKNIIAAAQRLCSVYGGTVPDTMEDLISLPGVARKTANIVLSSAFNKAEGIAVDVHVKRLAGRLGLSVQSTADKIEQDLMALLPRHDWIVFNYLIVDHGRAVCMARKPRCAACVLRDLCPSAFMVKA